MLGFPSTNHRSRHRCEIRTGNFLLRSSGPVWRLSGRLNLEFGCSQIRRTSLVILLPAWKPYNHVFICVCTHTFFWGCGNLRQRHVSINSFQRSNASWVFKTVYRIFIRILLVDPATTANPHRVDDFSAFYCWTHTSPTVLGSENKLKMVVTYKFCW